MEKLSPAAKKEPGADQAAPVLAERMTPALLKKKVAGKAVYNPKSSERAPVAPSRCANGTAFTPSPDDLAFAIVANGVLPFGYELPIESVRRLEKVAISNRHLPCRLTERHTAEPRAHRGKRRDLDP